MSYKLFNDESLEKTVANLLFFDTADFWMGGHSHDEINRIIRLVDLDFLSLAEEVIKAVRENFKVQHYFNDWGSVPPECDLQMLSEIGKNANGEKVSAEEFISLYHNTYRIVSSIWRVAVVAGTCIVEHAEKYMELESNLDD